MHAYQYTAPAPGEKTGECTIVIETTDAAWRASGLAVDDEAVTAAFVEQLFAAELKGGRLLTNRSHWRQFPTYQLATWRRRVGNCHVVLLGDAAHTAHFSIGSGTKLAMEDAIALHAALVNRPKDLRRRAQGLRAERGATRSAASSIRRNVSLAWFENVRRFCDMPPWQFNLQPADAQQADHLREPAAARSATRRATAPSAGPGRGAAPRPQAAARSR